MKKAVIISVAILMLSFCQVAKGSEIPQYMPYLYEDFEDGTVGVASGGDFAAGGYGNSAGCLKYTQSSNMAAPSFPMKIEDGKSYKISMHIKMSENLLVNNGSFILNFKSKSTGQSAYVQKSVSNVDYNSKEWVEVTIASYTFDGKAQVVGGGSVSDADGLTATIQFRVGNGKVADITTGSSFSYYIDDVSVIPNDLPISEIEDYYPEPEPEINPDDLKDRITNGNFVNDIEGTWTATNASIEVSEDVPEGEAYEKSLHVTETGNNGRFEQNVKIDRGFSYKLCFWAKGISAKSGVNLVGSAIVPRFVSENGTTVRYNDADGTLKFTTEWKKYEVIFKAEENYTSINFITGTNGRNRTEYIITGISFELYIPQKDGDAYENTSIEKYSTPEIRNLSYDGFLVVGHTVNITAEYLGINEKTGLVQLLKKADDGGWASIMISEFTDDVNYKFRNEDVNQEIKIRIVPMDIEGQIGGYREIATEKVLSQLTVNPEFTTGIGETVGAKISVKNYGNDVDIVGILVLLDEDNACINSSYAHSRTVFGESDMIVVSVSNQDNKAVKAKLYIWEGISDIETTMLPLADSIELK